MHDTALHHDGESMDVRILGPRVFDVVYAGPAPFSEECLRLGIRSKNWRMCYYRRVVNSHALWRFERYLKQEEEVLLSGVEFAFGPETEEGHLLLLVGDSNR